MEEAIRDRLRIMQESAKSEEEGSPAMEISKITELILDGYSFPVIRPEEKGMLQEFSSLCKLTCNQTGLASLNNFPPCAALKVLELTDNHIRKNLEVLCEVCPNVKRLELGGNHIENFEDIQPLEKLCFLEQLGLDMNPLAQHGNYKQKVWEMLPNLKILDGFDREGKEVDLNTDDEGDESEDEEEDDSSMEDDDDDDEEEEADEDIDEEEEDEEEEDEGDEDEDAAMETDSPNRMT